MFTRTETPYYSGEFAKLWRHELASGKNTPLTEALDYAIGDVQFSADGRTLWLTAEDKGVVPVFKLNADGTGLTPVHATGTSTQLSVEGGTVAFLNDTTSRPNELFVLPAGGGPARQLTHVNDDAVARLDLGKVESYWFKGAAGADIHGWLVYPPGYDPQKRYPLVQLMHGGPHTMNRDSWSYRWNTHVLASPGYVVTWVNRHGSTGFGEAFSRSIVNQWGDMPFEDIMKSTDYLLARFPNLDKDRLAAAGASYGGYMATWVLGHTDRFKAIINHAGVNNSYSQFATDVPHGFAKVMGGTPVGERGRPPAQQPDVLREPLQDAHARDPRRARLPRALRQRPRALRRPAGDGRALAPRRLPEREPLGALAPERHLLALGDAELARALHRRRPDRQAGVRRRSSSSVR